MRLPTRTVRALAHLLAAVALATCSDGPTGPRAPRTAHLAFAPVFSERATAAAAELQTAGIAVASIRVVITRPGTSDVLVDRVIEVPDGESSVTLEVDVTIRGAEEPLTAKLQYRDASGTVLYEGEQTIVAKQGTNAATELPETVVDYVGPGASAVELTLAPADTVISTTTPVTLVAKAKDAQGVVVESPLVVWSSSDAALATVAAGVVTPVGGRGVVKITAKIPSGIAAEATLRLVPPPTQVAVYGGAGQSAFVGTSLPALFKIEVKAADGVASPGVPVTFEALTDGGSVGTATATTDADGHAWTVITLGSAAGEYTFRATAGSLQPVTVTATALPLPAKALQILAQPTGTVESGVSLAQPIRIQLVDSTGKAAAKAGIPVTLSAVRVGESTAPVTISGTTTVSTGAEGIAEFTDLAISGFQGEVILRATAEGLQAAESAAITLVHGVVATLLVKPAMPTAPIAATAGQAITQELWLQTHDAAGNIVPNEPVRFVVHAGTATGPVVQDVTIATDANGHLPASSFPVVTAAGVYHVVMSAGTPVTATASLVLDVAPAVVPVATLTKISGDAQADTIEANLAPLVIELRDANGAPVANQQIFWEALPTADFGEYSYPNIEIVDGGAQPDTENPRFMDSTVTGADGRAQIHARLGWSSAHAAVVRARVAGQELSTDFTMVVKPGAPDWIEVLQEPDSMRAGQVASTPLEVRVNDREYNPIADVTVIASLADYSYGAELSTTPVRKTTSRSPWRQQQATSGSTLLRTASLNAEPTTGVMPMPSASTAAVTATLSGGTATTDATGMASFPDLKIGGTAQWYTLELDVVSTVPLREGVSTYVDTKLQPGPLVGLAVHFDEDVVDVMPGARVAVHATLSDAWNNAIADSTPRTITWSSTSGGSFERDSVTVTTSQMIAGATTITFVAPLGVGTVTSATATTGGIGSEPVTLTGTSSPIRVISSVPNAIVYGAATALEAGDRQVRLVGETLTQPLLAKVLDASGLPLGGITVEWRLWNGSDDAAIDTTVTDVNGVTSLQPTLSGTGGHGYVFEATPIAYRSATLRFQAATRPDASYGHVWLGQQISGSGESDWSVASNWDGGVPTTSSRVVIPHWTGVTIPRLTAPVEIASVLNPGWFYTPIFLNGQTLTITGNVDTAYMTGTGLVRLTGTGARAHLITENARLEIAPGASITVVETLQGQGLDVQGTLDASDDLVDLRSGGDLTVGGTGRLTLGTGGVVNGARNVTLEAGATLTGGSASISFSGSFAQQGSSPISLDPAFVLQAFFNDATSRTISLPAGSRIGHLMLYGSGQAPAPITLSSGVEIQGQLHASGVALTTDSVLVNDFVRVETSASLGGVGVLVSRTSEYAPLFFGPAPRKVILEGDASLSDRSTYDDLEIRRPLSLDWGALHVNGALTVLGEGALRMEESTDTVIVRGAAHFAAAKSAEYLRQGTLILHGDFMQAGPNQGGASDAFQPGPELEVVLAGDSLNVTFSTPRTSEQPGSYFSRVRSESKTRVRQKSGVSVTGRLEAYGQWIADDYQNQEGARLLDISGEGTELGVRSGAAMQLSRLNLQSGVKVDVADDALLTARSCYNRAAGIIGKLTCDFTSDFPLVGTILGVIGSTSPLRSVAVLVATTEARAGE